MNARTETYGVKRITWTLDAFDVRRALIAYAKIHGMKLQNTIEESVIVEVDHDDQDQVRATVVWTNPSPPVVEPA